MNLFENRKIMLLCWYCVTFRYIATGLCKVGRRQLITGKEVFIQMFQSAFKVDRTMKLGRILSGKLSR